LSKLTIPYEDQTIDSHVLTKAVFKTISDSGLILINPKDQIEHYSKIAQDLRDEAEALLDKGIRWKLRGQAAVDAAAEVAMLFGRAVAYETIVKHIREWEERFDKMMDEYV
jgi:hypothetical protein